MRTFWQGFLNICWGERESGFLFDIPIFYNECEFLKPKCPLDESGARLGGC